MPWFLESCMGCRPDPDCHAFGKSQRSDPHVLGNDKCLAHCVQASREDKHKQQSRYCLQYVICQLKQNIIEFIPIYILRKKYYTYALSVASSILSTYNMERVTAMQNCKTLQTDNKDDHRQWPQNQHYERQQWKHKTCTKHIWSHLTSPAQFAPWNLKQLYKQYDYVSSFLGFRTLMLRPWVWNSPAVWYFLHIRKVLRSKTSPR